jgi:hypothetical protein
MIQRGFGSGSVFYLGGFRNLEEPKLTGTISNRVNITSIRGVANRGSHRHRNPTSTGVLSGIRRAKDRSGLPDEPGSAMRGHGLQRDGVHHDSSIPESAPPNRAQSTVAAVLSSQGGKYTALSPDDEASVCTPLTSHIDPTEQQPTESQEFKQYYVGDIEKRETGMAIDNPEVGQGYDEPQVGDQLLLLLE